MRSSALAAIAWCLVSSGCFAYAKSERATRQSPRREAVDIVMGGLAQVIVGSLVTVGGYYLYQNADPMPERDKLTGSHGGVAAVLLGSGIIIGGLADSTIALYQALANDHLMPPRDQGSNTLVRTPLTP